MLREQRLENFSVLYEARRIDKEIEKSDNKIKELKNKNDEYCKNQGSEEISGVNNKSVHPAYGKYAKDIRAEEKKNKKLKDVNKNIKKEKPKLPEKSGKYLQSQEDKKNKKFNPDDPRYKVYKKR